jgi:hypothetical protein
MFGKDGAILTAIPLSSFAGIVLGLVNWLLSGQALVLHHPFDADVVASQSREHRCATFVLPGPVLPALAEAGIIARGDSTRRIAGLWRSVSQWRNAPRWTHGHDPQLIDMLALGEFTVRIAPRDDEGNPDPNALTGVNAKDCSMLAGIRTPRATLALRDATVPTVPFPPGAALEFPIDDEGFLDTGYPLHSADGATMPLDTRPGIARIGGYPIRIADIERQTAMADPQATIAVLPHALTGSRLAGSAADPVAMGRALSSANPLLGAAFVSRRTVV